MYEKTLIQFFITQVFGKFLNVRRLNSALITFALNATPVTVPKNASVDAAIAGIVRIALHDPPFFLKGVEYHFLKYQGIELA